jgi:hypothetical protein
MSKFAESIFAFKAKSLQKVEDARVKSISSLFLSIIMDSAVDTGNFTANWKTSQNQPDLTYSIWGNRKQDNPQPMRDVFKEQASAIAYAGVLSNIGDGYGKDTVTYLSNSVIGYDEDAKFYGGKIEYGYPYYAWDEKTKKAPPSKNVLESGYSKHSPKGMVRINVANFVETLKEAIYEL